MLQIEGASVGTNFGAVVYATRMYAARSHCHVVSESKMADFLAPALTAPVWTDRSHSVWKLPSTAADAASQVSFLPCICVSR